MKRRPLLPLVLALLLGAVAAGRPSLAQDLCANALPPLSRTTFDDDGPIVVLSPVTNLVNNLTQAAGTWNQGCSTAGSNRQGFFVAEGSGRGPGQTTRNSILIDYRQDMVTPISNDGLRLAEWNNPTGTIILYGQTPDGNYIHWDSVDMRGVLAHELGHALGLGHDGCQGSIMQGPGVVQSPTAAPNPEQCAQMERVQSPVCSTKRLTEKLFFRGCPNGCSCPDGTDGDDPLGGLDVCDVFGTLCDGEDPFPWYTGFYTVECSSWSTRDGSYTEVTCREVLVYSTTGSPVTVDPPGLSGNGPAIRLDSLADGQRVAGTLPLSGSVVAPVYGLQGLEVWVDDVHVNLASFLRGLPSSASCAHPGGGTDPACPNIGFSGLLDTTTLSEGPHVLKLVALNGRNPYPVPTLIQRSFVVDNVCDDSTPPSVSLTAPAGGSTVRGNVTVTASAADNVGVTKVELLVDGSFSANDSTAPYSFAWNSAAVADGSHTLRVRAFDACGNTAFSSSVTVTVQQDAGAPQVAITAPAAGALLSGTRTLSASASDDVGVSRVELLVDGVLTATDTNAPYSFSWNTTGVADGTHNLQARAWDAANHSTLSLAVPVTTDNTLPLLFVDNPANGAVAGGAAYRLSGWAVDLSRVVALAFYLDDVPLTLNAPAVYGLGRSDVCSVHPGDPNCPNVGWEAYFDTTRFASGAHTLQVTSTDAAGNVKSFSRSFSINNDLTPPSVGFTAPASGAIVRGSVTVSGTANDNIGVTKVELYVDGALIATDTAAPYSFAWNSATAGDGAHTLTLKAYDARPNTTSAGRTVTVDNLQPVLRIVSGDGVTIANGGTYNFPSVMAGSEATRGFTLYNDGGDVLNLTNPSSFVAANAAFTQYVNAPATLAAASTGAFRVRFASASAGTYSATVTVRSDDPVNGVFTFTLRGTITPAPAPVIRIVSGDGVTISNGGLYSFPSTPVNVEVTRGFTIFNDGNATLTITNPSTLVSGSAALTQYISAPASIAAGASGAFRVRLRSATSGTFNATVTLQSNAATFSFTLRGTVTP